MENSNWKCISFYDNNEPIATETAKSIVNTGIANTLPVNQTNLTPVLSNTLTQKGTLELQETPVLNIIPEVKETASEITGDVKTAVKKKSTLWIWGAAYLASILIAPSENPNYIDKSNTNVTP